MKSFLLIIAVCFLILAPLTVSNALNLGQETYLESLAGTAGYQIDSVQSNTYLDSTIGKLLASIFTLVGISFLSLIIVSGFQWINAHGNEESAKKAKDRIIHATIGLIIIASSYLISFFIYNSINSSITGEVNNFVPEPGLECIDNTNCIGHENGPYCNYNQATGYCGGCTDDDDCSSPTPECVRPLIGPSSCHECVIDADCSDNFGPSFVCGNFECIENNDF
ncbi:hypothetical protein HOE31_02200 [bacterium]|jgi:hypothetical protein|nr:hypothetical protein [bacterium]MBT4121742.1 hypothetical protein [bacterium]MBT4335324.1 hypothetical protein [bacterium]MBT4495410.1 hypothetical protein [bacterium]MBT4763635.1 hypothetical protein [bacterium]